MNNFNLYSKYYDLLYQDKHTEEECMYILELIKKNGFAGKRWLEYGSGSGRHGKVFIEKGIKWEGVDRSEEMVSIGIKAGLNISVADIGKMISYSKQYDAVLALFHVVSYIVDNQSLLAVFKNANNALKMDGAFIFDVWYSPAVYYEKPEIRVKKVFSDEIDITRTATPFPDSNANTVNVHYDIEVTDKKTHKVESFSEEHLMRHFSLPELKLLAGVSGFVFLHAEEWLTKEKPSQKTWGVTCVLKKTKKI